MQLSKVEAETIEPGVVRLGIEVPQEEVKNAVRSVYSELRRQVRIPGFRPGKAPDAIIRRQVGEELIKQAVLEKIAPDAFQEAIKQKGIEPLTLPDFQFESFSEGEPLHFHVQVAVKPEVKLGDYKSIRLTMTEASVSEEEVQAELERLRQRFADFVEVDKAADTGDQARVKYVIEVEGEPSEEDWFSREFDVGEGDWFPPIHLHLVGKQKGEAGEFEVDYPSDFPNEQLRGKRAKVKFEVEAILQRQLPELNDEFARNFIGEESLEELKQTLRERLAERAQSLSEQEVRRKIEDALLQSSSVVVARPVVEGFAEETLDDVQTSVRRMGSSFEAYLKLQGKDLESYKAQVRQDAERVLKLRFILEEIARQENIDVSDEEVMAEARQRFDERILADEESLEGVRRSLRRQLVENKVMQFLMDIALGRRSDSQVVS